MAQTHHRGAVTGFRRAPLGATSQKSDGSLQRADSTPGGRVVWSAPDPLMAQAQSMGHGGGVMVRGARQTERFGGGVVLLDRAGRLLRPTPDELGALQRPSRSQERHGVGEIARLIVAHRGRVNRYRASARVRGGRRKPCVARHPGGWTDTAGRATSQPSPWGARTDPPRTSAGSDRTGGVVPPRQLV